MNSLLNNITNFDHYINGLILNLRQPALTELFKDITMLGESRVIVLLVLVVSIFLYQKNQKQRIAELWLTVAGSVGFTYLLKIVFDRPRPADALVLETSASFPSGHATVAMAFYGFIIYLLLKQTSKKINRILIGLCGALIITAIGFSRLYLGVHYLSDVLVGYLVGGLWLLIGIKLNNYFRINFPPL